jgi:hypothetical protein
VILSLDCAAWLDDQRLASRRTTGASLSRSKLLRGIVAGVMNGGMDFSQCRTEREVAGMLAFILNARGTRRGTP